MAQAQDHTLELVAVTDETSNVEGTTYRLVRPKGSFRVYGTFSQDSAGTTGVAWAVQTSHDGTTWFTAHTASTANDATADELAVETAPLMYVRVTAEITSTPTFSGTVVLASDEPFSAVAVA